MLVKEHSLAQAVHMKWRFESYDFRSGERVWPRYYACNPYERRFKTIANARTKLKAEGFHKASASASEWTKTVRHPKLGVCQIIARIGD